MTPDKHTLRAQAKLTRETLQKDKVEASELIAQRFPEKLLTRFGPVVAGYLAIGSELDPALLLSRLKHLGAEICLPRVETDDSMTFRAWKSETDMEDGPFGLVQPHAQTEIVSPTLVLAPMLAFDGAGNRLGYGKGHYDRALAKLRANGRSFVCGLAYAGQQVAEIPTEQTDIPLDWMVTEEGSTPFFFSRAL